MYYNNNAPKKVGNVFEFILIAAERSREINRARNADGLSAQLRPKKGPWEFTHEQAIREIGEGTVGREYLAKVRSRDYRTKMR